MVDNGYETIDDNEYTHICFGCGRLIQFKESFTRQVGRALCCNCLPIKKDKKSKRLAIKEALKVIGKK